MQDIDASQSGRWYHWQAAAFAIPRRGIEIHDANMQLIPADGTVGDVPDGVRRGQIVELRGYLVRAGAGAGSARWPARTMAHTPAGWFTSNGRVLSSNTTAPRGTAQ